MENLSAEFATIDWAGFIQQHVNDMVFFNLFLYIYLNNVIFMGRYENINPHACAVSKHISSGGLFRESICTTISRFKSISGIGLSVNRLNGT